MTITNAQLAEERSESDQHALSLIGKNLYDQTPAGVAAVLKARQCGLVWIDPSGLICKERRRTESNTLSYPR